jgi:hypothetical protein
MFVYLFGSITELLLWVGGTYLLYRVIFSKSISDKKIMKLKRETSEKLSLLTLKSSDPQEVTEFIKLNVNFLSQETFKKLTEHLDFLNVLTEVPLKTRFEHLEKNNIGPQINEIILNEPIPTPIEVLKNPPTLKS